ncbi:MAG: ribosome maturation factor RimP [Gemmatimonadales bacterium]|nr:ribosome maturation factor RimP [Gemmatimonadales bacterium]
MSEGGRANTRQIASRVIELLEVDLSAQGFDLLDVRVFQGGGRSQVRIYVDTIEGEINLGQCTKASRTVGMLLEEVDLFADPYVIEVTSPGVRRPLRKLEHFQAAVGQKVDLKLKAQEGIRRAQGVLQEVLDSQLVILREDAETEPVALTVDMEGILEASLDPDFDVQALINADRRRQKEEKRIQRREKSERSRKKSRPRAKKE